MIFHLLKAKLYARVEDRLIGLLVRLQAKLNRRRAGSEVCPSLESLAAFVDHKLRPKEKQTVEDHLADCRRCRKIVVMVFKSQQAVPDPLPSEPAWQSPLRRN